MSGVGFLSQVSGVELQPYVNPNVNSSFVGEFMCRALVEELLIVRYSVIFI